MNEREIKLQKRISFLKENEQFIRGIFKLLDENELYRQMATLGRKAKLVGLYTQGNKEIAVAAALKRIAIKEIGWRL